MMRWLSLGLLWACADATTTPTSADEADPPRQPAGPCTEALDQAPLCLGGCPTLEAYVDGLQRAYAVDTCGDLEVVQTPPPGQADFTGASVFFDDAGTLVGMVEWSDIPEFCDDGAFEVTRGEVPSDCGTP